MNTQRFLDAITRRITSGQPVFGTGTSIVCQELMEAVQAGFPEAQIDAGADCILLADHATRDLCSPAAYQDFLLPLHQRMAAEIKVPLILHIFMPPGRSPASRPSGKLANDPRIKKRRKSVCCTLREPFPPARGGCRIQHVSEARRRPMCRNRFRDFLAVFGLVLVALSGLKICRAETLEIGSPAPAFSLPGVDGKTYSLESFRDADILVVVFTCNHCPTAQAYEGRIQQLAKDYKDKKVALVAISPNDPEAVRLDELGYSDLGDSLAEMKIRAKDKGFAYPYLYDGANQKVSREYGPVATPHVFVFDRARKLRFAGRIDNSENPARATSHDTRNAIEALLAGKPVPLQTTKVFGCSIKWSDKRESVKQSLETWAKEEVGLQLIGEKGIRELVKNDSKKLRLINVWATWCGPCVAELPEFVTINRMYRQRDFELITISANAPEEKDKALEVLKKKQMSARNYLFDGDDKYKLMDAVDEQASGPVPHTILVAPGGKVLYRHSGSCEPAAIKRAIADYLGRTYK